MRVLTFDVGKTGCRAALWADGARSHEAEGPGPVGLANADGARAALRSMTDVAARLDGLGHPVDAVVAGLAGLLSAPEQALPLLDGLAAAFGGARVVVTSDAITSHAGALSGRPGVVLAAGTGTSVVGLGHDGAVHLVDGWGYLLGDAGSGYAIGRAGIDDAMRAHDGRGGSAALLARLEARWGTPRDVPRLVQGADNPARVVASFARDVFDAARAGDPGAASICEHAAADLADSTAAAARRAGLGDAPVVATTGGLLHAGPVLTEPFDRALAARLPGARRQEPDDDALAGGHLLATRPDLPHLRASSTRAHDPADRRTAGPNRPETR